MFLACGLTRISLHHALCMSLCRFWFWHGRLSRSILESSLNLSVIGAVNTTRLKMSRSFCLLHQAAQSLTVSIGNDFYYICSVPSQITNQVQAWNKSTAGHFFMLLISSMVNHSQLNLLIQHITHFISR